MIKNFVIYGNCQSGALLKTLNKNKLFQNKYNNLPLRAVQTLTDSDTNDVVEKFRNSDLVIYQSISDKYRYPELSSNKLLKTTHDNAVLISFVSLYFNGYFPHLDVFNGKKHILNLVHDYIIMLSYVKGMKHKEILDLMNDEKLYSKEIALSKVSEGIDSLKNREKETTLKIADYIEENYKNIKLFNQFNHPKGIIFDKLANQIFDILNIPNIAELIESKTGLDGIMTPVYKSTYKQLDLTFEEDFSLYSTVFGPMQQDNVVYKFLELYKTIDKNEIMDSIKNKKPFLIEMFNNLGI